MNSEALSPADDAASLRRASDDRPAQEAAWLTLTRKTLPALAAARRWPVRADHCFQRILLDMT